MEFGWIWRVVPTVRRFSILPNGRLARRRFQTKQSGSTQNVGAVWTPKKKLPTTPAQNRWFSATSTVSSLGRPAKRARPSWEMTHLLRGCVGDPKEGAARTDETQHFGMKTHMARGAMSKMKSFIFSHNLQLISWPNKWCKTICSELESGKRATSWGQLGLLRFYNKRPAQALAFLEHKQLQEPWLKKLVTVLSEKKNQEKL